MDWANLRDMKRRFGDEKGKIQMLTSLNKFLSESL